MHRINLAVSCVLTLLLWSISAYPYGIGFYTTGKAGISTYADLYKDSPIKYSVGAGFVYDSAVATNELFNYRLNAGYENIMASGNMFFKNPTTHRVNITSDFGLGIIRHKYIRLWAGPQLELGCDIQHFHSRDFSDSYYTLYSIRSIMFTLGFGAVFGLNVHAGDVLTIGFDAGINTTFGVGQHHSTRRSFALFVYHFTYMLIPTNLSRDYNDNVYAKLYGFFRLSFIFRVGDVYQDEM